MKTTKKLVALVSLGLATATFSGLDAMTDADLLAAAKKAKAGLVKNIKKLNGTCKTLVSKILAGASQKSITPTYLMFKGKLTTGKLRKEFLGSEAEYKSFVKEINQFTAKLKTLSSEKINKFLQYVKNA